MYCKNKAMIHWLLFSVLNLEIDRLFNFVGDLEAYRIMDYYQVLPV